MRTTSRPAADDDAIAIRVENTPGCFAICRTMIRTAAIVADNQRRTPVVSVFRLRIGRGRRCNRKDRCDQYNRLFTQ